MIQIDMQMPDNCDECRFNTVYGFCKALPDNFCGNTDDRKKPEWCPLKKQELPTELKIKMWNALYAEEDKCEKEFVGTDKHDAWFNTYRPWLQRGFDIAIKAIADWEGR